MMKMFKSAILAAALSLSAGAASAVTVPADGLLSLSTPAGGFAGVALAGGPTTTFTFEATEDLKITGLSFSALGFNSGNDVANLTFGYNTSFGSPASKEFDAGEILPIPFTTSADAETSFASFNLAAGETFTFFMDNGDGDFFVIGSGNFTVAAVPLPAAGLMLLTALLGAGVVARRRQTTTA